MEEAPTQLPTMLRPVGGMGKIPEGGISWTDHPITQIWYPSQGIHPKKGVLTGAYVFYDGDAFADKSLSERLELALEGGELLHPGRYRKSLEHGISISWRKAKYSAACHFPLV